MPEDRSAGGVVEIRVLGPDDHAVLERVAPEVFDGPLLPDRTAEFLADPRHHVVVAVNAGVVVGMASAVHYVHPDKHPELWIDEVGVAESHRRQGLGGRLIDALLAHGAALGCTGAWVLTEEGNEGARRLYTSAGGRRQAEDVVLYQWSLDRSSLPAPANE